MSRPLNDGESPTARGRGSRHDRGAQIVSASSRGRRGYGDTVSA